jgi:hypothetical protein
MGMGYGLASPGIFRSAPGLNRGLLGGQANEDPLAALIGNALGTYTSQTEKAKADALAAQREQDQANWRDLQTGIALHGAGLTTQAPPDTPGPGTPTTQPAMTGAAFQGPMAIRKPDVTMATPSVPAQPVERIGGTSLYEAGRSAAEQRLQEQDAHARRLHQLVGHALAQSMLGHDVDDPTAEGFGAAPAVFAGLDKSPPPRNIDPLSPLGIQRSGERAVVEANAKPPDDAAQRAGASASDMAEGARAMREILTRNPSAASGAYNKLLILAKHPIVGSVGLDVGRSVGLIGQSTDDERNFMTAAEQYMNGKLGLTSGSRITENQYRLHLAPIIPSASETPGSIQTKANLIDQSVRTRLTQTQRAFRDQYRALQGPTQAYLNTLGYDPTSGQFHAPAAPAAAPPPVAPSAAPARVPNYRKFEHRRP